MCESLDRMREEASNKGFIKSKIQGKTEGIQIGKEDGILMILTNLLKKGISDLIFWKSPEFFLNY